MAEQIPGQLSLDLDLDADETAAAGPQQAEHALEQWRAANQQRAAQLAQLGRRPDPAGVLMARLNLLLDMLLDDDTRTHFELAFEQNMAGMLTRWTGEARQMQLLAPPAHEQPLPTTGKPPVGGGLFLPG